MMTVSLGTCTVETAVTIFAPSFAIPPASYFFPTMYPVMFWRKRRGIPRCPQSSMKWAALREDSEKRIPWFARIPTG